MTYFKAACLCVAAMAGSSAVASADDLADLKAQIEALNTRISQLEAAPSVPAGYHLVTITKSEVFGIPETDRSNAFGKSGTAIAILPTADMPATTTILWTGFVAAALTYNDIERAGFDQNGDGDFLDVGDAQPTEQDALDVKSKAGLNVTGKTDTAVGEVGVSISLLAEVAVTGGTNRTHDNAVATDGFRGWWKFTPELELSGGVFGSLAKNGQGWKGKADDQFANDDPTGHFGTNLGNDPAQLRLTYKSGPIALAVAVEDNDNTLTNSTLGLAGEFKYSGDMLAFELNAGYWDSAKAADDTNWTISAGAGLKLSDSVFLSAALGAGEDRQTPGNADSYTKGSLYAAFDLSDAVLLDLGVAYRDYKARPDMWAIGGGLYYNPVEQLTLGIEVDYQDETGAFSTSLRAVDQLDVALVSVYRF